MPAGEATRPTAERAREGLFSTLTSLCGSLESTSFLDLYAGSGAVGLEAASRGASRVTLVERDPAALRAMHANIETLQLAGVEVRADLVERMLAQPSVAAYDVVFLDPPYADPVDAALARLIEGGWLAEDGVACVERGHRDGEPPWPEGIAALRSRRYGEAMLWYGRRS